MNRIVVGALANVRPGRLLTGLLRSLPGFGLDFSATRNSGYIALF